MPAPTEPAPSTHDTRMAGTLSHRLVLIMATATGLGVACLYYAQPLLGVLTADMGLSEQAVGYIPTLTQLGYALGIIFLAPLGVITSYSIHYTKLYDARLPAARR